MSITVADCLKLTSLSAAKVVAGFKGLSNIVVSVSVLEYAEPTALDRQYFKNNEIVITAFISIKDDIEAQCLAVRRLYESGEVGLILYYVGVYMPKIDEKLIETANELGFPLICMPEKQCDLRYSEVICEVMEAIFKDKMIKTYFVGEILERISQLPSYQRTMDTVLRMISDRIHCTIIMTDRTFNMLNVAAWPMTASGYVNEVVDYYKINPLISIISGIRKVKIGEKMLYTNCQALAVDYGLNLNLIIINEAGETSSDCYSQAVETVQLFINIWSQNEGNVASIELVRAILNDEPVKMRRLADILHIDVSSIHIMWVLENKSSLPCEEQEAKNIEIMIKVKQFLNEHHRLAIVDIYKESVVAFMDNPAFKDEINSLAEACMNELDDVGDDITLTLCTNLENTTEVRAAYVLLENHIKNARIIFPRKKILTYHEVVFASHCYEIILHGEEAVHESLLPLKTLRWEDKEQEKDWIITLATFMLDTQTSISQTAELLFVHKSTVKYRIHKISERLNYNILKLPESYSIYMALAMERLLAGLK